MIIFESHSNNIFSGIQQHILSLNDFSATDLVIVCKNGEQVQTHMDLLCMFVPDLRNICESISGRHSYMIFLPDFRKMTVEKMIMVLRMDWRYFFLIFEDDFALLFLSILYFND